MPLIALSTGASTEDARIDTLFFKKFVLLLLAEPVVSTITYTTVFFFFLVCVLFSLLLFVWWLFSFRFAPLHSLYRIADTRWNERQTNYQVQTPTLDVIPVIFHGHLAAVLRFNRGVRVWIVNQTPRTMVAIDVPSLIA